MAIRLDKTQWPARLRWFAQECGEAGFSRMDAADLLRCERRSVRGALEDARNAGIIEVVGSGRTARYFAPCVARAIRESMDVSA